MATAKNDGFLEGLTTPWDFGSQDDTIYRADILWEPADTFSLRFTYNDEQKRGTDPKIHRMTRYDNSKLYAYNIMLGGFQAQANAACAAGFTPSLPLPSVASHDPRFHGTDVRSATRLDTAARQYDRHALHGREAAAVSTPRRTRPTIRTASSARRRASSATTRRS